MKYKIYNSEFVAWANSYEGKKFHAVLCDPPYALGFMGQKWDNFGGEVLAHASDAGKVNAYSSSRVRYGTGTEAFQKSVKKWGKALRKLLYPGALVFMFGGTRTWHRLAVGMEDAGFELWDTIMWLHGQGFPKAQNVSKLIDSKNGDERKVTGKSERGCGNTAFSIHKIKGFASSRESTYEVTAPASKQSAPWSGLKTCALKPAWEPILCFRAPDNGKTYAELAMKYGSGCLNVDKGRIKAHDQNKLTASRMQFAKSDIHTKQNIGARFLASKNIVPDMTPGRYPANLCLDKKSARMLNRNASRFFYTAKAPKYEREEGLEKLSTKLFAQSGGAQQALKEGKENYQIHKGALSLNVIRKVKNFHPTVKPVSLNKWLAAMLLPAESVKRRRLLVPFSGSGSEMIGALRAGWDKVIGVEMNKDYCRIAKSRLKYWKKYKPVWKNLI